MSGDGGSSQAREVIDTVVSCPVGVEAGDEALPVFWGYRSGDLLQQR